MQLDVFTLMLAIATAVCVVGAQIAYFWLRDRAAVWLGWLAAAFLVGSGALFLYIPRGEIADYLSIGLANALLLTSFGFAWQAARAFERRPARLIPVAAIVSLWLVLCLLPEFMANFGARTLLLSLANAAFSCLIARELWRGRSENLPSRIPAVLVMLAQAFCLLLRVPYAVGTSFPTGATPGASWVGFSSLASLVLMTSLAILMVSMTKERREMEQRNFALSDYLTGLPNRRALFEENERMRGKPGETYLPVALLMLDLDHFKSVNDRFGHAVGDRVLRSFSIIAKAHLGPGHTLYRVGGEEFCLLLRGTGLAEALHLAERIRTDFAACEMDIAGARLACTVSIGMATGEHAHFELSDLLSRADAAVYAAKAEGRNRIAVSGINLAASKALAA